MPEFKGQTYYTSAAAYNCTALKSHVLSGDKTTGILCSYIINVHFKCSYFEIVLTYFNFHIFIIVNPLSLLGTMATRLTHCYLETRKRVMGKQCRPRSDAT